MYKSMYKCRNYFKLKITLALLYFYLIQKKCNQKLNNDT